MKWRPAVALITATMSLELMAGSVVAAHPESEMKFNCMYGEFAEYNVGFSDIQ